jgi:hypothetical protein
MFKRGAQSIIKIKILETYIYFLILKTLKRMQNK